MRNWDGVDWYAYCNERAGILEYDEGLTREQAEQFAKAEIFGLKRKMRSAPLPNQ
jgi:hypothetical protein